MNKNKFYLSLCNIVMAIPFIYLILFFILNSFELTFTNISFYTFFIAHIILTIIILVWPAAKTDSIEISQTYKCGVGIALFNLLLIFVIFFISSFLYEPENFIHINGKRIVSRGSGNSSSIIAYYETKTIFIRSQTSISINAK